MNLTGSMECNRPLSVQFTVSAHLKLHTYIPVFSVDDIDSEPTRIEVSTLFTMVMLGAHWRNLLKKSVIRAILLKRNSPVCGG